ncbi:MAG: hypothetical protein WDO14_16510 [Bacteroidota bacterium]
MTKNIKPDEIAKVTMKMTGQTLSEMDEISEMTDNANEATVVARAVNVYKYLLELQRKKNGRLLLRERSGNLLELTFEH